MSEQPKFQKNLIILPSQSAQNLPTMNIF